MKIQNSFARRPTLFAVIALAGLTVNCQAQQVTFPKGSEAQCYEQSEVSTAKSPSVLWQSITACVLKGKYEQAAYQYGLAGSLGAFDSMRIKDPSARQAAKALPMMRMAFLPPEKAQAFQRTIQEQFGDDANRASLCSKFKDLPVPDYYPEYMIQHGLARHVVQNKDDVFVQPFDASGVWTKAVDAYMQCPIDKSN